MAPWGIGLAFLLLYVSTAAPSIVAFFDDTLEFQLVLPTFGIAHPTGYPLYTILGGLWSRLLPLGEWAGRANLFSALCAAVAVGLLCALTQEFVRAALPATAGADGVRDPALWAGIVAALAFGLGPTWRAMATVAEVYALHGLFVALIFLFTLRALAAGERDRPRAVTWVALAVGLGLTHHRMTLLLMPAAAVALVWAWPGLVRPQRAWWAWAGALFAPLLLYLWLPLRYAMGARDLNAAFAPTWAGFWNHVLARGYGAFLGENELAISRTPGDWIALGASEVGWIALALAGVGLAAGIATATRRGAVRPAWALLLIALAANLSFALAWRVGDVEVFLLPVWLCLSVAAGAGVVWLMGVTARTGQWWAAPLLALALAAALIPPWAGRAPGPNRGGNWDAHDAALALSVAGIEAGSRVIGLEGEMTALRYMQQSLGRAPGVAALVADDPALRRARLEEAAGAPTWLTRELPGIERDYSFSALGALVRVWPRGHSAPPPPQTTLDLPFAGGALHLVGYDLEPLDGSAGRFLRAGLHWLPTSPLTQTLKLSLRVVDPSGASLSLANGQAAQSDLYPLRLVAPTTTWLPGERVRDEAQIALPPAASGAQLLVILYDEESLAEAGRALLPIP